jgi:hypothetical protein
MVGFFSFSLGKGSKMRRILGKPKLKEKRRKKGIYSVFPELSPPLEMVDDIKNKRHTTPDGKPVWVLVCVLSVRGQLRPLCSCRFKARKSL